MSNTDRVGGLCDVSSLSISDQGFEVQVKVINYFAPRSVPGGKVLYWGDTANKDLYRNDAILKEIGIPISELLLSDKTSYL